MQRDVSARGLDVSVPRAIANASGIRSRKTGFERSVAEMFE